MNIIINIISDDEYEFTSWFKDVIEWIMKKAFTRLSNDPVAIKILQVLYDENSKMLSPRQIFSKLCQLEDFSDDVTIGGMEKSIAAIQRHVIFIEEITSDDHESKLKLTDRAIILWPNIFKSVEDTSNLHVSKSPKYGEMDHVSLLNSVEKRTFTWEDFADIINGFLFVKTNSQSEKQLNADNTLSVVEDVVFDRILDGQRKYITTQFKDIVRFLAHAGNSQKNIAFARKYLHLFIENFDSIADVELAALCGVWFSDRNQLPFFEGERPEVLARLYSRVLSRACSNMQREFILHIKTSWWVVHQRDWKRVHGPVRKDRVCFVDETICKRLTLVD